MHKENFSNG